MAARPQGAAARHCKGLDPGSKNRLTRMQLEHFSGSTLFEHLARAVCEAEVLPRKELFEAWETARRVRRRFRGGPVVDLAAGHGLLAWILMVLDDSSPSALCVDVRKPSSADRLQQAMLRHWPRLAGRVSYVVAGVDALTPPAGALLACVHGCGPLTDTVLDRAIDARLRVAVLPCCQGGSRCDSGELTGWLAIDLAVDVTRVARLRAAGFRVWTAKLPEAVTPKNRLLMAEPL